LLKLGVKLLCEFLVVNFGYLFMIAAGARLVLLLIAAAPANVCCTRVQDLKLQWKRSLLRRDLDKDSLTLLGIPKPLESKASQGSPHKEGICFQVGGNSCLEELLLMACGICLVLVAISVWQWSYGGQAFRLFFCLPQSVDAFVPGVVRKIQDIDHLSLIMLAALGSGMFVQDMTILQHNGGCSSKYCVDEAFAFVFLLPCTLYVFSCLGAYDEAIYGKRKELDKTMRAIEQEQDAIVKDMTGFLEKAADSNAGLAERQFESHRRDFIRFLEWFPEGLGLQDGISHLLSQKDFAADDFKNFTEIFDIKKNLILPPHIFLIQMTE